jgi:hypothetical protein
MMVLVFGILGGFARLKGQGAIFRLLILGERFQALDKNPMRSFEVKPLIRTL